MGFYQDYDDRRQVVFQFDRIFSNRKSMDTLAETGQDGVFSGRFVLVKYDPQSKFFEGDVKVGYYYNNIMYQDAGHAQPYTYTTFERVVNPVAANWNQYYYYNGSYYFKLPNQNYFNAEETNYFIATNESESAVAKNQIVRLFEENFGLTQSYYKCSGSIDNASGSIATWSAINYDNSDSTYLKNYNIDKATYGTRFDVRGYDATIWEKVYSKGRGSFVLIAYLNGVMPALDLFADPPTQTPAIPYIDALSSDSYYRIHIPSMYGFQLKEHDEDSDLKSDQKAIAVKLIYNANTNSYEQRPQEIDAAIYLNLDGANEQTRHVDTSTVNKIIIEPTGESGKIYTNKDGTEETHDLMELSVQLPAIGNMIAKGYDLIYGEVANNSKRLVNIDWISGTALDTEKHNIKIKSYDTKSIAGCINNIHDIMGQIIVDLSERPSPEQVEEQCSDNLLYRIGDKYYRKGIAYNKTPINNDTLIYDPVEQVQKKMLTYKSVGTILQSEFQLNKYYTRVNGVYVEATSWSSSATYYLKRISGARYIPVDLEQFNTGQFYYLENEEDYICDNSSTFPLYPNRTYYQINIINEYPQGFTFEFEPDQYFIQDGYNFNLAKEALPVLGQDYCAINFNTISSTGKRLRFYVPGYYYYYDEITRSYKICNDEYFDSSKTYAIIVYDTVLGPDQNINNLPILAYQPKSITVLDNSEIQDPPSNIDYYYYLDENGNYIAFNSLKEIEQTPGQAHPITESRVWTVFKNNTIQIVPDTSFYINNRYWYKDTNNSYIKSKTFESGRPCYLIESTQVPIPFYLADTYYYEVREDEFELAGESRMINGRRYCTKEKLYVYNDTTNQCPYGYEWNDYAAYIPPSVTLYQKESYIDLIPIEGLINGKDSIYGQALALHKMFGLNDEETRNTHELRGAFNTLQDLLYTIKTMKPGRLLYVNDFGQIEATDDSITIDALKALL